MDTAIDEIADGIYRFSTYAPQVAPPAGLTCNVFLILGEEPLLFHTGKRGMFPAVFGRRLRQSEPAAVVCTLLPMSSRVAKPTHLDRGNETHQEAQRDQQQEQPKRRLQIALGQA